MVCVEYEPLQYVGVVLFADKEFSWEHSSLFWRVLRCQSHSHGARAGSVWPAVEGILSVRLSVLDFRSVCALHGDYHCRKIYLSVSGINRSEKNLDYSLIYLLASTPGSLGTDVFPPRILHYRRPPSPPSYPDDCLYRPDLRRYPILCDQHVWPLLLRSLLL